MVNKYYKQELFISHDGGSTWTSVGAFQKGALIEKDSPDCVYVPPTPPIYRWVKTQCTICVEDSTPLSGQYLTFIAQENGTFTFTPTSSNTISYSLDSGSTWTQGNSVSVSSGQKVMWKGTMTPSTSDPYGIGTFSSTSNFTAEGNPMSLLFGDNYSGQTDLTRKNYAFARLFIEATTLTSAENLSLPATTLSSASYVHMFGGCSSLTTAPQLPATTLNGWGCYALMFSGCTSLITAPELPATTLANSCYMEMFEGCTSLTTAPTLPATTLASGCYLNMFNGCTSLTTAPQLPATTLAARCYDSMFSDCGSLTTAPELPVTALTEGCYFGMFMNCDSLTTAPELLAPTLADNCYTFMFYGCTNLNYIKCLATDITASNCTNIWVSGVAASGTFVKAASMTGWTSGSNGIPNNWTVQNAS